MVAGGAESPVSRISLAGFAACRALSTGFNDTPERASRPYDRDRDGFVMGEGAGSSCSKSRNTRRRAAPASTAKLVGYGLSGDAYHITAPAEDGDGALRCMTAALKRAGMSPADIDYINAHGTSTPLGDEIELGAVERLVGNAAGQIAMSSTKSSIGHLLGAAGAVEAIFCRLGHPRSGGAADHQSRQPLGGDAHRSRAAQGEQPLDQRGAVELVRLRRHQCFARFPAIAGIVRPIHCFAIFAPHSPATQYGGLPVALPNGQCGRTGEHSPAGWGLTYIADHA